VLIGIQKIPEYKRDDCIYDFHITRIVAENMSVGRHSSHYFRQGAGVRDLLACHL